MRHFRCSDLKELLNELKDETGFDGLELAGVLVYIRCVARALEAEEAAATGAPSDGAMTSGCMGT